MPKVELSTSGVVVGEALELRQQQREEQAMEIRDTIIETQQQQKHKNKQERQEKEEDNED
jgi:hypothetical protein